MATTTEDFLVSQAATQVAVGVLHLLFGIATVDFPGSTKANPSHQVVVSLTPGGPLDESFRRFFPFRVRGPYWHRVVVPVYEDTKEKIRLGLGDTNDLIRYIEGALLLKAREEGYLPPDSTLDGDVVQPLEAPGEPVNRTPWIPTDESFERFDT